VNRWASGTEECSGILLSDVEAASRFFVTAAQSHGVLLFELEDDVVDGAPVCEACVVVEGQHVLRCVRRNVGLVVGKGAAVAEEQHVRVLGRV
jgi:hypothetical protein